MAFVQQRAPKVFSENASILIQRHMFDESISQIAFAREVVYSAEKADSFITTVIIRDVAIVTENIFRLPDDRPTELMPRSSQNILIIVSRASSSIVCPALTVDS